MLLNLYLKIMIFVFLLASAVPALADTPVVAAMWRAELKAVDQKLRAKQWAPAEKLARKAAYDIAELAGTGEGASYSLAVVSAFRAIAAAGLGKTEDAAWHWDTALNLFPDIAKTDVSPYGSAAVELRTRKLREAEPDDLRKQLLDRLKGGNGSVLVDTKEGERNITPPRIIKQPRISFPTALNLLGSEGVVVVSAVIGEDGRLREPRVIELRGGGPAMKYVALDALREWRFEPAKLDRTPAAVYYVLTVNFHDRR
ncbi:MAG TPA: energy transducer TonB [Thermoanaerobaculia bacterium]|jgi:hypothetical protein|nr:energy transducer TonB [Thermoanaerobaculia bacterium]